MYNFPINGRGLNFLALVSVGKREIKDCGSLFHDYIPWNTCLHGSLNVQARTTVIGSLDCLRFLAPVCTHGFKTRGWCTCTSFERRLAPAWTRVIAALCASSAGNVPPWTCRPFFRFFRSRNQPHLMQISIAFLPRILEFFPVRDFSSNREFFHIEFFRYRFKNSTIVLAFLKFFLRLSNLLISSGLILWCSPIGNVFYSRRKTSSSTLCLWDINQAHEPRNKFEIHLRNVN